MQIAERDPAPQGQLDGRGICTPKELQDSLEHRDFPITRIFMMKSPLGQENVHRAWTKSVQKICFLGLLGGIACWGLLGGRLVLLALGAASGYAIFKWVEGYYEQYGQHHQLYIELGGVGYILSYCDAGLELLPGEIFRKAREDWKYTFEEYAPKDKTWNDIYDLVKRIEAQDRPYNLRKWNCQHYAARVLNEFADGRINGDDL